MNVWMKQRITAQMSSISVSTLVVHTSVNVNRTCTLSMGNAEVRDGPLEITGGGGGRDFPPKTIGLTVSFSVGFIREQTKINTFESC